MLGKSNQNYSEDQIQVLEGIEGFRKRPEMYIGSRCEEGVYHLFREIISNSIDEFLGNYGKRIEVSLSEKNEEVRIRDYGRGIPFGIKPEYGISALELLFTKAHAGGKFGSGAYQFSGGLHGVGGTAVNALSEYFKVISMRDGKIATFYFEEGILKEKSIENKKNIQTGTEIIFKPDKKIFPKIKFSPERIISDLRNFSYLNSGLELIFSKGKEEKRFYSKEGLKEYYVENLASEGDLLPNPINLELSGEGFMGQIVFGYSYSGKFELVSFVNNIPTKGGGQQVVGFKNAITFVVNAFQAKIKEGNVEKFTLEEVNDGLKGIFSLKWADPAFESQTKEKLTNPEARKSIYEQTKIHFEKFLRKNSKIVKLILQRCLLASKTLRALKKSREVLRKTLQSNHLNLVLPGKLTDCTSKNQEETEIFITEGNSAAGTAKAARDKEKQAILPIRGKILNVYRASEEQLLKNTEVMDILTALALDIFAQPGERTRRLRYSRIILMADADPDGGHILCLLSSLFFKFTPELIQEGRLYFACPPLYRVSSKGSSEYVYSEKEFASIMEKNPSVKVQRYKGLGVMNPDELGPTTMKVGERKIKKITISDVLATEYLLKGLMCDDSSMRKSLIMGEI